MRPGPLLNALFLATAVMAPAGAGPDASFRLEKRPPDSLLNPRPSDTAYFEELAAYVQVRAAGFGEWADSGIYIGTRMGPHPQVHQVAAPGADRRQLTFFPRRMSGFHFNPVPARKNFLFTEDKGGNEEFRLRLFDLRTGRGRDLGCPPGKVGNPVWNDSGTRFAYSHTPKGSDRWDIRMGNTEGRDTLLLSREGTWSPLDLSPDGGRLLVQKYVSATESQVHILSLRDGSLAPLLPGEQTGYVDGAFWLRLAGNPSAGRPAGPSAGSQAGSRDGSWAVGFVSDREGEFRRLYRIRPGDSLPEPLSHAAGWDVEWAVPGRDRRALIYSLNVEGRSRLFALDNPAAKPAYRKPQALPGIPDGIVSGVRFRPGAGGEFAFTLNGATFPGDVFTYKRAARKATRWTYSETGGIPPDTFTEPELIRYPTFDSLPASTEAAVPAGAATHAIPGRGSPAVSRPPTPRTIPAWYYLPSGARTGSIGGPPPAAGVSRGPGAADSPRRPLPVLILVHGGPEMQARAGFDPFLQFAAGRMGMAVVQPNVRGSSGYGKSWLKADDGYLRMNSVRDLGALLDWIRTRPELDPERVAVAGRSYGGFMALSALIEYDGRLRAGISTVGITHFPTFLKRTSGYRRDLRRAEYGDERDPEMAAFLDRISPLTRLDRLNTPLLLCHGRNDPRVPYGESERIFAALGSRRVPAWFLTFEEEGHAVRDQQSLLALYGVMADFLTQQLGLSP